MSTLVEPSDAVTVKGEPTGAVGNSTFRNQLPELSATVWAVAEYGEVTVMVAPGVAVPEYSS